MSALILEDGLLLGVPEMDAVHEDFVLLCNRYCSAVQAERLSALEALISHCEDHFERENRLAEWLDFPPCHRNEHNRVLEVMRRIRDRLAEGDASFAQRLAEELPEWFRQHATTMDAALAGMVKVKADQGLGERDAA